MAINRRRNNRRFDVDAQGLRSRWAQLDYLYDGDDRLPDDSDTITKNALEYAALLFDEAVYFGYDRRLGFDSDFISDIYPIYFNFNRPGFSIDNESSKQAEALRYENLREFLRPIGNQRRISPLAGQTLNYHDFDLLTADDDGNIHYQNSHVVVKYALRRILENDFFARKIVADTISTSFNEDSEYFLNDLAINIAGAYSMTNAGAESLYSALFNNLDEEVFNQTEFDSDRVDQYGNRWADVEGFTANARRRQLARIIVDGLLDSTAGTDDSEIYNGVEYLNNQFKRLNPRLIEDLRLDSEDRTALIQQVIFHDDDHTSNREYIVERIMDQFDTDSDQRTRLIKEIIFHPDDSDSNAEYILSKLNETYADSDDPSWRTDFIEDVLFHVDDSDTNRIFIRDHIIDSLNDPNHRDSERLRNTWNTLFDVIDERLDDSDNLDSDLIIRFAQIHNDAIQRSPADRDILWNHMIDELIISDSDQSNEFIEGVANNIDKADSDDVIRINNRIREYSKNIIQHYTATTDSETVINFTVPTNWDRPYHEGDISVLMNGVMLTTDDEYDHTGTLLSDTEVTISFVNDGEVRVTMKTPIIIDDVITIKYLAVRTEV